MFKINRNTLTNAMNGLKSGIASASAHGIKFIASLPKHYNTAKKFLGDVNDTYTTAKRAYSVLEPIVKNPSLHSGVMKAISGYETIRNKVMDTHDTVANNIDQVKSGLKKAGIRAGI